MGPSPSRPKRDLLASTSGGEYSLRGFADVELQSIFHCLPPSDLLRFGRTSKQLQRVFDHSLTWKYAKLRLQANYLLDHRSSFSSRLLSHVPVALECGASVELMTTAAIDVLLKP